MSGELVSVSGLENGYRFKLQGSIKGQGVGYIDRDRAVVDSATGNRLIQVQFGAVSEKHVEFLDSGSQVVNLRQIRVFHAPTPLFRFR